jgi:hypothetical protein
VYLDARAQGVEVPELGEDDIAFIAAWWKEQWAAREAPASA